MFTVMFLVALEGSWCMRGFFLRVRGGHETPSTYDVCNYEIVTSRFSAPGNAPCDRRKARGVVEDNYLRKHNRYTA